MALAIPTSPGGAVAAWAIAGYQRFISPYKGFRCAHRACHGRASCSEFARRVAIKRGVVAMFVLLRKRFVACAAAAKRLAVRRRETRVLDYEPRGRPVVASMRPEAQRQERQETSSCTDFIGDCGSEAVLEGACHCGPDIACGLLDGI